MKGLLVWIVLCSLFVTPGWSLYSDCVRDVILLVDRSGSIAEELNENGLVVENMENWYKVADFVIDLVKGQGLIVSADFTRLAIVTYANDPRTDVTFGQYDWTELDDTLDAIQNGYDSERVPAWGESNPYGAFVQIRDSLIGHPDTREDVKTLIVYIGDGQQNVKAIEQQLLQITSEIKSGGTEILVVGVGNHLKRATLQSMATSLRLYHEVDNLDNLHLFASNVSDQICKLNYVSKVPANACHRDIMFTVDRSGSIAKEIVPGKEKPVTNMERWYKVADFVNSFIQEESFSMEDDFNRIALVSFANRAKTRLPLDQHNLEEITDNLMGFRNGYPYEYEPAWGNSNIYGAMKHVREYVIESEENRPSARDVIVYIGDGDQNVDGTVEDLLRVADDIKSKGALIICIGVGNKLNSEVVHALASDPSYVIEVAHLDDLDSYKQDVFDKVCSALVNQDCFQDVVFSIDRSGSMVEEIVGGNQVRYIDRWYNVADFVTEMVLGETFDISTHGTHMALVSYANDPYTDIEFGEYSEDTVSRALAAFRNGRLKEEVPAWGESNPYTAFVRIRDTEFHIDNRASAKDVIVFVSDGQQNVGGTYQDLVDVTEELKASGVTIIVIGVGMMLDRSSLMNIVSDPMYYFEVADLAHINNYVTPVGEMVCDVVHQTIVLPQDCLYDIALVVDQSGSMSEQAEPDGTRIYGRRAWYLVADMVADVVNSKRMHIGPEHTHLALISFSDIPLVEFDLSEYDREDIEAALEVFKYGEQYDTYPAWGMSDPDQAFTYTWENVFTGNGDRMDRPNVIVYVGDGQQNVEGSTGNLTLLANSLKMRGVAIVTVGVGVNLNEDVLKSMAYTEDHYIKVADITDVEKTVWQTVNKMCEYREITTIPITTTMPTTTTTEPTTTTIEPTTTTTEPTTTTTEPTTTTIEPTTTTTEPTTTTTIPTTTTTEPTTTTTEPTTTTTEPTTTTTEPTTTTTEPTTTTTIPTTTTTEPTTTTTIPTKTTTETTTTTTIPTTTTTEPTTTTTEPTTTTTEPTTTTTEPTTTTTEPTTTTTEPTTTTTMPTTTTTEPTTTTTEPTTTTTEPTTTTTEPTTTTTEPTTTTTIPTTTTTEPTTTTTMPTTITTEPTTTTTIPTTTTTETTTTTTEPTTPPLYSCPVDIVFLMDSSGSIKDSSPTNESNYDLQKDFIVNIIERLDIGQLKVRVGLVRFSTVAKTEFVLNDEYDKEKLIQKVRAAPFIGGKTNIADALELLYTEQFVSGNGDRHGIDNIAIFISDGTPTVKPEVVMKNADEVKARDIRIVTVGVTSGGINEQVLLKIASGDPPVKNKDYFLTMDFQTLGMLSTEVFAAEQCQAPSAEVTCRQPADIFFVLDSSGSIDSLEFKVMKSFAKAIAMEVGGGNTENRLGLIGFSGSAEILINLEGYMEYYQDTELNFYMEMENLQYMGGTTNLRDAIVKLNEGFSVVNGSRAGYPNVVIIFTDGEITQTQAVEILNEVNAIRHLEIHFIVVGIGPSNRINDLLVKSIASYPHQTNYIHIPSFTMVKEDTGELRGVVKALLCNDVDECDPNLCECGSPCIDLIGSYFCACQPGCGGVRCEHECREPRDVVFALDAADGMTGKDLRKQLDLVQDVILGMNIDTDNSSVALLGFGTNPITSFDLNDYTSKLALLNAVSLKLVEGYTYTDKVITTMYNEIYTVWKGDNEDIPDMGVIVSESSPSRPDAVWQEARIARKRDIHLMTVNIGDTGFQARTRNVLETLATGPTDSSIVDVSDFDTLSTVATQIIDSVCNNINECDDYICENGGTPVDEVNHCRCICPDGYSGVTCSRGCTAMRDIVFLIDNSGRLERMPQIVEFLVSFVQQFQTGKELTRFAAITFNEMAHTIFNLKKYDDVQDIVAALRSIKISDSGTTTSIAAAFEMAETTVFIGSGGNRQPAENHVIVLAESEATADMALTIPYAKRLRQNQQVHISVLGIGSNANNLELRSIVNEPIESSFVYVESFNTLMSTNSRMMSTLETLISATCNEYDDCSDDPCQNGGQCTDYLHRFSCTCNSDPEIMPYFAGKVCDKSCSKKIDVTLMIDLSRSMRGVVDQVIAFARQLLMSLPIDEDIARLSVVTYADSANLEFDLNEYKKRKQDMLNAMAFVYADIASTNIRDAIELMHTTVFDITRGDRRDADNVGVLMSDGGSTKFKKAVMTEATVAKQKGIHLYVVTFDDTVNDFDELNALIGGGNQVHVEGHTDIINKVSDFVNTIASCSSS